MNHYHPEVRQWLTQQRLQPGSVVRLATSDEQEYTGTLLEPLEGESSRHIVLQLSSGYIVGLAFSRDQPPSIHELAFSTPSTTQPAPFTQPEQRIIRVHCGEPRRNTPFSALPHEILSVQAQETSAEALAKRLLAFHGQNTTGVVLLHPADSLVHTASLLSWMLSPLPFPVVCVGITAHQRLDQKEHLRQLDAAHDIARQSGLAEVMICSYPKDTRSSSFSILRANHSRLAHIEHTPVFESINHAPLGSVSNGRFVLQQLHAQPIQPQPSPQLRLGYRPDVLWLPAIEGMTPPHSLLDMPPGGIVLSASVAGQLSDSWRSFIWQLRERGVVVLACQQNGNRNRRLQHSESGRQLLSWGVLDGTLYLPEVALWKLGWALAQSAQEPSTTPGMWLEKNIAGECREA